MIPVVNRFRPLRFQVRKKWVLGVFVLFFVVSAIGAARSRVDNSLSVWQSGDSPAWIAYQNFVVESGLTDPLLIYIPQRPDLLTLDTVLSSLDELPGVAGEDSMYLKTTRGNSATLITITPTQSADQQQMAAMVDRVPPILTENGISSFYLGGVWYLTRELDALSARSTAILFPVVIVAASLLVIVLCRSYAAFILGCGLLAAFFLVGIMGWFGIKLNMVLLALPPLTLILGLSHAVHFSIGRRLPGDTVVTVFQRVAPPCTLSALTTGLGFASLLLSRYQPVRQLGFWGMVGALLSLFITFALAPIFIDRQRARIPLVLPGKMVQHLARHRRAVFLLFSLMLLLAIVGIGRLEKGSLILDFFTDDSSVRRNYQVIEGAGIGLTPLEINLFAAPRQQGNLEPVLLEFARNHSKITHFLYFFTDHSRQITSLGAKFLLPPGKLPRAGVVRVTVLVNTVSSEQTLSLARQLEHFLQQRLGPSPVPYVTGSVPLYTSGQQQLFVSMLQSFATAFFSICLLMGVLFRSVRMGLIAMVPNLLPVVLVLGCMGWFGIPLSVATVTVASIVFGIVVDDTIHFLYTYQRQERTLSRIQRLEQVLAGVGAPILATTVVTGTGFLAFLASPFIPLRYFGLLISLAIWLALLCDLTVLPVLLMGENTHVR